MPYVSERATINQTVQIGAESTSALGTTVAASKLLEAFTWTFGINGDVVFYTPTGHKYANAQEENTEWVDGTLAGDFDYNHIIYPLAGVMGAATAVAHSGSTIAKDWVFTPPVTGSVVPQTYTIEQGDAVRAMRMSYGLFNSFGYTFTRKAFTISGGLFAQPLSDGIVKTASPVAVPIAPAPAKQINAYLDSTSAALGTTQLLRLLSATYAMNNVYGQFYAVNRANLGYTAHVDLMPGTTMKLKFEANAEGMAPLGYLQTGATYYLRVNALGSVIDNNQTVTLGAASAGTFTLSYKGQTTTAIAYNATAATVQTALQALSTIGAGNATVSGSAGGPYTVSFLLSLATDVTAMTGNGTGLTGGTFAVTQTQAYTSFTHDMAVKANKPSAFADDQGVYAIEWDFTVVEDPTWTKAQTMTVTNTIAAL